MSHEMYTDSATSDPAASLAVLMAESGKTTLYDLARVTIAAGYSKPRTIETVAELDALPVGTVVHWKGMTAVRAYNAEPAGLNWVAVGSAMGYSAGEFNLPATVLYEPAP